MMKPVLATECGSGNENPSPRILRRSFLGGALAAAMLPSRTLTAEDVTKGVPGDIFILLLQGLYQPVAAGQGPAGNLGLTTIDLSDGTYATTKIYPVFGIAGVKDQDKAIGTFYGPSNGNLCAYDLPGGSIAMTFLDVPPGAPPGFNNFISVPDGAGGAFLEATFELNIQEATGIYSRFQGGHNHMVDKLHALSNGGFNEFCFCNISTYDFP